MEGFRNCNEMLQEKKDRFGYRVPVIVKPKEENRMMKEAGFEIDRENSIYTRKGYGAYHSNTPILVDSIEDLRDYEIEGVKPYDEFFKMIDEDGYKFVLGPGAPADDGIVYGQGIYCTNYKEILRRQKSKKQKVKQIKSKEEER